MGKFYIPIAVTALAVLGVSGASNLSGFPGCDALSDAGLEGRVSFATNVEYETSISSYFAGNIRQLQPWCIVQPRNADEVSAVVKALVKASPAGNWNIAVRGGGHSSWASSNVDTGVTIDLSFMNATVLESSTGTASIGPGARWGSVYLEIEKYNKTLTGSREGQVGVGGLLLGGGASFYSGRRGFSCDDVINYEVVLADGSIVQANPESNPDLFKGLKGGTNNFGIVTRFDMRTFDMTQGGMYGGLVFMPYDQKKLAMNQFVRLVEINRENPDDTEVLTFTYSGPGSEPHIIANAVNTAGNENSTSFAPFRNASITLDDRSRKTYGELITKYLSPGGLRQVWFSLCFGNNIEVVRKATDQFDLLIHEMNGLVPNGNYSLAIIFQPLPLIYAEKNPGGNSLGLNTSLQKDSIIFLVQAQMDTLELESLFRAKLAAFTAELEAYALANDAATNWRYLNYVNPAQDPIASYGQDNVDFLKQVSSTYDPTGFFQTRVTGGFKVSRAR